MCARAEGGKIKPSARHALKQSDILYLSSLNLDGIAARKQFDEWLSGLTVDLDFNGAPVFTREDLPRLISLLYSKI